MKPLSLTFAQNTCKRNRKSAGQKYSARRRCRSFVAFMLSQSCSLVKRVGTYFVHVCRKCCTTSRKYRRKIVHTVGAGHARPAAYRHILFTIQSVGEGFIPPGHLSPPQASAAARGLAALRPRLKMRVGRGALTPPQFTGISLLRFIHREKSCPFCGASGTPPPTIVAANLPPYPFPLHAPSVHFPKFIHFFVKKSTQKNHFVL